MILNKYEIKSSTTVGVVENLEAFPTQHLLITPNPSNGNATISFELPKNSDVEISISDLLGNTTEVLFVGNLDAGLHQLPFELTSASGRYFCKVKFGYKYMVGNIIIEK